MRQFVMHRNEKLNLAVGFSNQIDTGDTLSSLAVSIWDGTTDVSTSGFTITNVQASTAIMTDLYGVAHPVGQAVTFTVEGSDTLVADTKYTLRVEATHVEDSQDLIAMDENGNPPVILVKAWGEA